MAVGPRTGCPCPRRQRRWGWLHRLRRLPAPASAAAAFPGQPAPSRPDNGTAVDPVRAAALELRSVLDTSGTTFRAQARLRDELAGRVRARRGITEHAEYEELFDRVFDRLQPDELRLHRTMRSYTESVLNDYNRRTLELLDQTPALAHALPSAAALRLHLVLWLAKFKDVFLASRSMCLLYVGVEERVGFPQQI
jgi:hypothetical protein